MPLGAVLADLTADGRRQYLYATTAPTGSARLVAADLDGRELWHHDFPAIPGTAPIWNTGGLILWQAGYFTDGQRQDVLVNVRRSIMHSDETYVLSGRDGRELWHRDHQLYDRGVGGQPFAIADYDGDGLDDAASLYPNIFYLLKGATGEDLVNVREGPYWGQPVAGDWESTGKPTVFFATERASLTGLYRLNGTMAWLDAQDRSPSSLAAFGDVDGDGQLEAVGVGYADGVRCYDTAGGKVKWRLPTPVARNPVGSASADLNGDGRDEVIFVTDRTLWCLGTIPAKAEPVLQEAAPSLRSEPALSVTKGQALSLSKGVLLWQIELPARLGPPAIADVDGTGQPSVLLVGSDGYVYCVKERSL
jgi:outer membrane protein assembly factor BamB